MTQLASSCVTSSNHLDRQNSLLIVVASMQKVDVWEMGHLCNALGEVGNGQGKMV